jgi:hypothetical protein
MARVHGRRRIEGLRAVAVGLVVADHVFGRLRRPRALFCVAGRCPAVVGSTAVSADGPHMTAEYSQKTGAQLAAAVLAVS